LLFVFFFCLLAMDCAWSLEQGSSRPTPTHITVII
jgi:hypothetical protein